MKLTLPARKYRQNHNTSILGWPQPEPTVGSLSVNSGESCSRTFAGLWSTGFGQHWARNNC